MNALAPVLVHEDRIRGTIAGLRPFRPTGYRVDVQQVGRTRIVHNYGHGGCGVTLSWGTAERAADLATRLSPTRAAVLGAGAVGLATARLLQERGVWVTVYARNLPPLTTSNVAGALWSPITLVDEAQAPAGLAEVLASDARASHRRFDALVGGRYGVHYLPFYLLGHSAEPPVSWEWAATPELFRPMTLGPGQHPFPSPYAHQYRLMMIDPAIYLEAVLDDVRAAGGEVVERTLESMTDIQALGEDVVVNCTGLGARALVGDDTLVPIKGQLTLLEPQPDVNYALKSTVADLYMFPRRDSVVLGGSHQRGDWSLDPDPREASRILDQHRALFNVMTSRGEQ
jgi:glycine/D-amino acid oxidase-like deaminating enzyme